MSSLAHEIGAFIASGDDDDVRFDALALALFAQQYARCVPYRRLCDQRGTTPQTVSRWQNIPTVPASAFKRFSLTAVTEAACTPLHGGRVFHSSGTTGEQTSRHFMDAEALQLYRLSLRTGYLRFVGEETAGIMALMPAPHEAPHSSLSFMLGELGAYFVMDAQFPAGLERWMRAQRKPVTYFGTAFAWVHLLDALVEPLALAAGSVVIETGGFKGRSREIAREELYALFVDKLGVAPENCRGEYGMSELASQFYSVGPHGPKLAPPWLRTRVIDPVTGEVAAPGEAGLLAHYDLANANSVLAIQTEDLGIALPGGGFTLLGRAPGAVLRGCSLLAEDRLGV